MTINTDFIPLDPYEGPTVWVRQLESNHHTYELVTGTDPDNPLNSFELSANEVRRLADYVEETHDE